MIHFLLLSIFIASFCVKADDAQHTGCYNYFLKKDRCVSASSKNPCPVTSAKEATSAVAFEINSTSPAAQQQAALTSQSHGRLARRYDTINQTKAVAGGNGLCGYYNTNTTLGVCLWTGEGWYDPNNAPLSGWLAFGQTKNCNKKVYVQPRGRPGPPQYAQVLDGCSLLTTKPEVGCFQMWMTIDLFNKFNPTPKEKESFQMNTAFSWDFVNEKGSNPV